MKWIKKIFCKCDSNLRIYGYAIEHAKKGYSDLYWMAHYNHKIYKSEEIAQEAIDNSRWEEFEYRIIPLYRKNI